MASSEPKGRAILQAAFDPHQLVDGVHLVPTQGNGLVVETDDGLVVVDGGPGGPTTRQMIGDVRAISDAPVRAIVYSHGHLGYNSGVDEWQRHLTDDGHPPAELIAHRNRGIAPTLRTPGSMAQNLKIN